MGEIAEIALEDDEMLNGEVPEPKLIFTAKELALLAHEELKHAFVKPHRINSNTKLGPKQAKRLKAAIGLLDLMAVALKDDLEVDF